MPSFGELLRQYIERAGITDAELARSTGVQRQTIFRWKEGLTARPRYREDILRIAAKLRLSPAERDSLLLAGGFSPDDPSAAMSMVGAQAQASSEYDLEEREPPEVDPEARDSFTLPPPTIQVTPPPRRARLITRPGLLLGVSVLVLLVVAVTGTIALRTFFPLPPTPPPETAVALHSPTPQPSSTPAPTLTPTPVVAREGEQLILIAPFVGYTSTDMRFNVAGRIRESLQEELSRADLGEVRIIIWPEPIVDAEQADKALADSHGVLAIWGEYDAGRVRAGVSNPMLDDTYWVNPVDTPSSLPFVINEDVPRDARVFALMALGSYFRTTGEDAKALAVYERARAQTPSDAAARAAIEFYIGMLSAKVAGYSPQSLTRAIDAYSETLALMPDWENARYNRGTSYLGRALLSMDERDDLDAAIADLSAVIEQRPARVDPLLNRGIAYYQRNGEGDLDAAIADFSRVVELQTDNYRGYYHRGLAAIRAGDEEGWQADLSRAGELNPAYAPVQNAYCWAYGTSGRPELSLPYCDLAVESDASGASLDSRAITLGQLGRHEEAAADLRAYLEWVRATYPLLYVKYRGPQVESWIEVLDQGENPFTPEVLEQLRKG